MTIYADDPNQVECGADLDEDIIVNDYTSFSSSLWSRLYFDHIHNLPSQWK
jgi:hypothetical protein